MLDALLHFLRALYNPEGLKELIRWGGAPLVCLIIFIETGFFVGVFLPGDSLLVTAGIFAASGLIPLRAPGTVQLSPAAAHEKSSCFSIGHPARRP